MRTTPTNEPQLIKYDPRLIDPSPFQSRKEFDPVKLAELTSSIKEHGIIQPLVARYPSSVALEGLERIELVAGERRMRAAIEAGMALVPVLISVISDATAEAMVLTENLQREGLTPAEEAHAFERLMALRGEQGEKLYTQESIAKMISKDVEYVVARIKLLLCPSELVKAVNEDAVSVSTAMLVGRIPEPKARAACARLMLAPEHQQVPLNYAQTKELIREHFMVRLDKKKFDLADPNLVPVKLDDAQQRCLGGDCMSCPFRSGNLEGVELQGRAPRNSVVAPEGGSSKGADAMLCTLPSCHKLKLDARWREIKLQTEQAGKKTLDGKAAEKAFGGHNGRLAHDSEYALWNDTNYFGSEYIKPSAQFTKKEVTLVVARHPETFELIELVVKKDVIAALAVKAKEQKTAPKSKSEQQREADEKEKRSLEIKKQKIEKIAVKEGITEIRTALSSGRLKLDEGMLERLFDCALDAAGADGLKFLAGILEVERDKKKSAYDLNKPVKEWVKANITTAPDWLALTVVTMLSRRVAWNGTDCSHFKAVLGLCGLKVPDLEKRAKTLLDADAKGKGKKKGKASDEEEPPEGGNSTDKTGWTADGEASKTAAADARAKDGGKRSKLGMWPVEESPAPVSGPSLLENVTGIQASKLGKANMWTAADVDAGALLLKKGTRTLQDLIGQRPPRSEKNKLNKYNAVRLQLMRKQKQIKLPKAEKVTPEGEQGALPL